jgi:excisionase family DNA binding protein
VEATTLIQLSPSDLEQLVSRAVSKAIGAAERGPCGFMRAKEAAAFLGLSENALRIAVRRGEIPVHRLGDRVLFSKDELDSFIRSGGAA